MALVKNLKITYGKIKAKNGEYSLFKEVGKVRFQIDDKADPTLKAKEIAHKQQISGNIIIVYGFGFGYHIRELLNCYESATIYVYDTVKSPFFLANDMGIIEDLKNHERLVLNIGHTEKMVVDEWDSYLNYLSSIELGSYFYDNFVLYSPIVTGQDDLSKEFRTKLRFISDKKAEQSEHNTPLSNIEIMKTLLANQINNYNSLATTPLVMAMINKETHYYYSREDEEKRRVINIELWSDKGGAWHNKIKELYAHEGYFEKERKTMLEQIERLVINNEIQMIVEIGTGNGMFLEYLAKRFKNKIDSFVGLDLNNKIIIENQQNKAENVEYWCGYTEEWINSNKDTNKNVLFIAAGTIYYFTQNELDIILNLAKYSFRKTFVVIVDIVDMDLKIQLDSIIRNKVIGTYSHNFSQRFKQCDYIVLEENISYLAQNYGSITISGKCEVEGDAAVNDHKYT